MTPDDQEDDRTVIRPAGSNNPTQAAGFQKTEWSAANAVPAGNMEKTQFAGAPSPSSGPDMGGNLPAGTRLGEFEITSLVGEGGFGIVYLAHDHSLQRRVALKEYMPSSLAQRAGGAGSSQVQVKSARHKDTFEAGLKSFINEARLLASFDHPSLVKVYRFWEANGTAYMVMPFLEGTTLKDVLRSLPQTPDEAWLRSVLGPLTEALLVIHTEQCYHRDIAPDNVMLLPGSNRWLLLDFGAARRVIGDMTQALTVILKPGYAPVEQYAEIPGMKQGPWTDVYALAAVVYFAIMGKTPPPSVGRLLNDTYVPLAQAAAGRYSDQFLSAIDRALAVRPEERTQSIGELRQDLGLGEAVFDSYTTRPLPPGTEMPQRTQHVTRAATAPSVTEMLPKSTRPATVMGTTSGPSGGFTAAPPPAPRKNNAAVMGVGIGAVVLAALGFGAYTLLSPSPAPAPVVQAPVPAPAPVPASAATPAPVPAPPPVAAAPVFDVMSQFQRIVSQQTAGFNVKAEARKTQLKLDQDEFQFSVTSDREGYLYVFGYSPDGTLAQLVPNSMSGTVRVKKGQPWRFPTGDGFVLLTQEPLGATEFLVMVSARQRNHEALNPRSESHVRIFPTGEVAAGLAARYEGGNSIIAGRALCPNNAPCADEYGAALMHFETIR